MATFVTTLKFTPQGSKNIGETTKRAASVKATAKKMGVKVRDIFWTLGEFDGLLILEAADDETATAFLLQIGSRGISRRPPPGLSTPPKWIRFSRR